MKKIRIFAICAITCIVFMICLFKNPYFIFILENINYNHISEKEVINSYTSNKKTFIGIASFAQNDINDLWINSEKDKQFSVTKVEVGKNTLMEIHNEKLSKQLIYLFDDLNYKCIFEEGNSIYFVRQTGIGYEEGIVLSKDGKKPNGSLIVKLEIVEKDWYYYESK